MCSFMIEAMKTVSRRWGLLGRAVSCDLYRAALLQEVVSNSAHAPRHSVYAIEYIQWKHGEGGKRDRPTKRRSISDVASGPFCMECFAGRLKHSGSFEQYSPLG